MPDEMRADMKTVTGVNWSKVARDAFTRKLVAAGAMETRKAKKRIRRHRRAQKKES